MRSQAPFTLTPWVRRLLVANAVVFLLGITMFTGPWFVELFAFAPSLAWRQPWTFVTYMFLHGSFLHIAFNMLMLFIFGAAVEEKMGSGAFARYYFLCGLGGAALSFVIALFGRVDPFVGASAAVFGVALAFAFYWPDAELFVFPIPFPIKAKWLVIILASIDLASAVYFTSTGGNDGTAHLAHLGGFLFGLIYLKADNAAARRGQGVLNLRTTARVLVHPSAQKSAPAERAQREQRPAGGNVRQQEVDRVLDKISASGLASLTPEERRFLDEMSKQMRKT